MKKLLAMLAFILLVGAACDGHILYPLPAPNSVNASASSTTDIGPATYPIVNRNGEGAFRTNCNWSHYDYDDPIVKPGQDNGSHGHLFFGNRDINSATTNPRTGTSSTCSGGLANLTGYWVPMMVTNTVTGPTQNIPAGFYDAPCSDPNPDNCERQWADNVDHMQVYYKCGYRGVVCSTIQPYPAGLKIVAGNVPHDNLEPDTEEVWWSCQDTPQVDGSLTKYAGIPDCDPGQIVQLAIEFPQCWDGENLDSANHRDHMAYGDGWPDLGCPDEMPLTGEPGIPLPEITEFIRWQVPFSEDPMLSDTSNWRLASDYMNMTDPEPDMYEDPGESAHADWYNGWDPAIMDRIVEQCLNPGLDCQMNNIGDDPAVSGTLLQTLLD
jgi:hypothetical protein